MITHLEQKAFVRKYNSELAIKGYTKLTRASLFQRIENTLKRSRTELKREWASMKSRPSADSNMAVKRGPKRGSDSNMAVKRGPKRSEVKPASAKRASAKPASAKLGPKKGPVKFTSKIVVAPGAQSERLNDATDRITNKLKGNYYKQSAAARRKAIIRDTALARRIRG
jgi:hypothetical protein